MDSEAAVLIGETQPGDDVWETGREGFDAGHDLGSASPLSGKLAPLGFVPLEPLSCPVLPTASMFKPLFLNDKLFFNKILGSPKSMS